MRTQPQSIYCSRMMAYFILAVFTLLVSACGKQPAVPVNPAQDSVHTNPYGNPQDSSAGTNTQATPATPPSVPVDYTEAKVGLLLPLSGQSSELGQALLDAAMLGLFDKYASTPTRPGEKRIVLMPMDTEGNPKKAAKAAEEVIAKGAELIIGPLYSESVKAVAPIARKHNINVISFSNNADVAGENSFLYGFMPEQQVMKVLDMAEKEGKIRIAALLPANRYGEMIEDSIIDHTATHGTELIAVTQYPTDGSDIAPYVQKLMGNVTSNDPIVFDALFLAEGGDSFTQMVNNLQKFRLTNQNVLFLGTGQLDDDSLLGNPSVTGTMFASSPQTAYRSFLTRFEYEQGYKPPRLASLAYDAVALAATLLERGGFSRELITEPAGYAGPANGIFRFKKDGTIERGLSVMKIGTTEIEEITPAPRMFY